MRRWLCKLLLLAAAAACAPYERPDAVRIAEALAIVDRGTAALRSGDLSAAATAFELAFENGRLPAALDGLGCVAFRRSDAPGAQRYFLAAYDADNSYTQALAHLALLYHLRHLDQPAETLYRRALAENPRLFDARNNFAVFLSDKHKAAAHEVQRELEKAYLLVPHAVIAENLGVMQGMTHGQGEEQQ